MQGSILLRTVVPRGPVIGDYVFESGTRTGDLSMIITDYTGLLFRLLLSSSKSFK